MTTDDYIRTAVIAGALVAFGLVGLLIAVVANWFGRKS